MKSSQACTIRIDINPTRHGSRNPPEADKPKDVPGSFSFLLLFLVLQHPARGENENDYEKEKDEKIVSSLHDPDRYWPNAAGWPQPKGIQLGNLVPSEATSADRASGIGHLAISNPSVFPMADCR